MKFLLFVSALLLSVTSSISAHAGEDYSWQRIELRGEDYTGGTYYYGGGFVQRTDGKILVTYRIGNKMMLSYVDTEEEFLSESNASAENEWEFYTFYSSASDSEAHLQRLSNGHILLYVKENGVKEDSTKPFRLDVYESANGLGTDFSLKSTIYIQELPYYSFGARSIGQAIEIDGRILLPFAAPVMVYGGPYDGAITSRLYCAISVDGGSHWKFSQIVSDNVYRGTSRGFGIARDQIFILVHKIYASGSTALFSHSLSSLNGEELRIEDNPVWEYDESYSQQYIGDILYSHIFWQPDGYTYLMRDLDNRLYKVFRRLDTAALDITGQTPYKTGPIGSGATWEGPLNEISYGDDGTEFFSVTPSGHLTMYGTSAFGGSSVSHLYVGRASTPVSPLGAGPAIRFLLLNSK